MKLVTFVAGSQTRLGAKDGDQIVDLNLAYTTYLACQGETLPYQAGVAAIPTDLETFLVKGDRAIEAALETLEYVTDLQAKKSPLLGPNGERICYPEGEVTLKAPISRPQKIIGIGLNYAEHCAETNSPKLDSIMTFAVFANAIVGPGENIIIPKTSFKVDWEAELVFVIGKRGKYIPAERALDYVAGYTAGNDVSVRDHQFADPASTRGKSGDTHAPIGPWIVTKDEIPDPQSLDIAMRVNGVVKQSSNTCNMIYKVSDLIAFLSTYFTLEPGDLIFSGTPSGVGAARDPQEWLKPGDRVEVTIEKIGTLTNYCVAEQ